VFKAIRGASVLAGLIVIGGAALGPGSAANAEDGPGAVGLKERRIATSEAPPGSTGRSTRESMTHKQLPNAKHADRTTFPLGPTGQAFQDPMGGGQVVGGTVGDVNDYPYVVGVVSIYWEDDGAGGLEAWQSTCTGTVLSTNKILTAGHCTVDLPLGTTYVIAGRNDLEDDNGGYVGAVASTWTHQLYGGYNGAPRYDVAVLTLKQPLPGAYTSIPLMLQGDTSAEVDMTAAEIVGYGITASGASDSGILRKAAVPIRDDATCTTGLGTPYDTATMVCAGDPVTHVDTCGGDSGGPLIADVGGTPTQVGVTSWGPNPCGDNYGAYAQVSALETAITADLTRTDPNNFDWTGDGHSDLVARTASGNLLLYYGTGLLHQPSMPAIGGLVVRIGNGWGGFTKLFRVKNWNGDDTESIMGRDKYGNLYQYRSDGAGNFTTGAAEKIGTGWNMFSDIMVTNNWTGNGQPNLLGVAPNGDLWLYTSNGSGGWMNGGVGIKIGNGWNMFDTILTPGDWKGDSHQALIGRTRAGQLRLYQGNGAGGWLNGAGVQIGSGWNIFTRVMSPGDLNGDNQTDIIGINASGGLIMYPSDGHGNWMNGGVGISIGTGWNTFTAIF
jgi:V8-like Glu-specific endopeptidase